ncbi:MAG: HEAT repeat domain-containing protein [Planctomycetota bacterium]|nr:HEAT repeat domain-containing protein [Planctomycetota bacterium]MDA0921337.1 HEAT repeat domain-containing protein [Planctomycetota bacterium]MDA1159566.1 HEAT repeat domain-containing protein [Planctomycetota bacterium]
MADEVPSNELTENQQTDSASSETGIGVSESGDAAHPVAGPGSLSTDELPEDLPPVQPPSASFIMQLFLVPGLIVAAVIAVWALFGKLSSSEQDWRQLVAEVRSNNEHRRWRGATGLAQMLRSDVELGESGNQLSTNPQIAKELATLLVELLNEPTQDAELTSQQSFLARTLGWLDSLDDSVPALIQATDEKHETIVRSDALRSIALIAGRAKDHEKPLDRPEVTDRLIEVSQDSDPLIRQVCAFTLGLIPGDRVDQRLRVLAEDRDANTRINAAMAMSRRGMSEAFDALLKLLTTASEPVDPATMEGDTEVEKKIRARSQENMNQVVLGNALTALRDLADVITDDQRQQAIAVCKPLSENASNIKIRIEAGTTLKALSGEE